MLHILKGHGIYYRNLNKVAPFYLLVVVLYIAVYLYFDDIYVYLWFNRAEIIAGGFVIEGITEDPPLCKVTYITRADLKGMLQFN